MSDSDDEQCRHENEFRWPDEDDSVWYKLSEERSRREYWCENDAVYVKLETVDVHWICTGCGEEKTIQHAERIGGEENIKRKSEMPDSELEQFRDDVHCGSFLNGRPAHKHK